jgi:hypothetical protein
MYLRLNENDVKATKYSFVQLVLLKEELNKSRRYNVKFVLKWNMGLNPVLNVYKC